MKISDSFQISTRWGSSNEYPQSMILSRNKTNLYLCKPQFYSIKVGFKGVKTILACFHDEPFLRRGRFVALLVIVPKTVELPPSSLSLSLSL